MDVYYSGNFWRRPHGEKAGRSIPLNFVFSYGGYDWHIPSAYLCTEGLVLDICLRIPIEKLRTFHDEWQEAEEEHLLREQLERFELENPMNFRADFEAVINGEIVRSAGGCGTSWQPDLSESHEGAAMRVEDDWMNAYHLERGSGWNCDRMRFRWNSTKERELETLSVKIKKNNEIYPCNKHFICKPGCEPFDIVFNHPRTSLPYELHILSCTREEMEEPVFGNEEKSEGKTEEKTEEKTENKTKNKIKNKRSVYPKKYCTLSYRISPDSLEGQSFSVNDCSESDRPKNERRNTATCISVISSSRGEEKIKCGYSSLHHEPVEEVEWYISVQIAERDYETINIL